MDPLVLIGVRASLASSLPGSILRELRDEPPHRYRLIFESSRGVRPLVVSLRAESPWVGVCRSNPRVSRLKSLFAAACGRGLSGRVVESVDLLGAGRTLRFAFSGGGTLVAELATHGANLLFVDAAGIVSAAARSPRAAQARSALGAVFTSRPAPPELLVAAEASAADIDTVLRSATDEGESLFEALRRRLFGVGPAGARLICAECGRGAGTPGALLSERIRQLRNGEIGPVVSSPVPDPVALSREGKLDPASLELLPWKPSSIAAGLHLLEGDDAPATAGIFYDATETVIGLRERRDGLQTILAREIRRLSAAEERALRDAESFADADRFRRFGEALLAGLTQARRVGDHVMVPDPYDPDASELAIPASPALPLTAVAEDLFRRNRRARRGVAAAGARATSVRSRRIRIQSLAEANAGVSSAAGVEALMDAMRAEGIAVGLEPRSRASQARAQASVPRLEGVRLFTSTEGVPILAGRTGKDNDRLTFRLAAPEDFWLHASGHPGAHVVLRNPNGAARPPEASLREAAAVAAWFSDARTSAAVDVQWTRKKHVRRAKGRGPGTVVLKRWETLRVRPVLPRGFEEEA